MLYPASRAAMTGTYESGNFKGAAKWRSHIVSSYYSNGTLGNKNDTESPSWQFGPKHVSIGAPKNDGTRCVRDYLPPSMQ